MNITKGMTIKEAYALGLRDRFDIAPCTEHYKGAGLYVLKFNSGIKIGISRNLKSRLDSYKHPWCRLVIDSFYVKTKASVKLEGLLKTKFREFAKDGSTEFFYGVLLYDEIVNFIKNNPFYLE